MSSIPPAEPPVATVVQPPPPVAVRITALLSVVVVLVLGGALARRLGEATEDEARRAEEREAAAASAGDLTAVAVVRGTPAEMAPLVVMSGTLEPVQAADLGFGVPGRIERVSVTLGELVHEGDVLVTLDRASVAATASTTTAAITVAETNVAMARDRVELVRGLVSSGAAPARELTTAEQQLAIAEATLAQARSTMATVRTTSADHSLRAPFDGVVTRVPEGVGAVVAPGQVLVAIEDLSSLRLETTVSQSELAALTLAPDAPAVLEAREGVPPVAGRVTHLVRSLDEATRRAPAEVLFPNADGALVAHALVRARVVVGAARPALRIVATARRPDGSVLLVNAEGRVEARIIDAQQDLDGSWLVTSGLDASDRVVVRPASTREGALVTPTEPSAPVSPATAALP